MRVLLYHPESDTLFEGSWEDIDGLVEDVTGISEFEDRFKEESAI